MAIFWVWSKMNISVTEKLSPHTIISGQVCGSHAAPGAPGRGSAAMTGKCSTSVVSTIRFGDQAGINISESQQLVTTVQLYHQNV